MVKRFIQTQLVDGTDYYTLQIGNAPRSPRSAKRALRSSWACSSSMRRSRRTRPPGRCSASRRGRCATCDTTHARGEVCQKAGCARGPQGEGHQQGHQDGPEVGQIDAVLRTGALSEAFTQDIGPAEDEPDQAEPTAEALRQQITTRVRQLAPDVTGGKEKVVWITERTGLSWCEDNYQAILRKLETQP